MNIAKAIKSLQPDAQFSYDNEDYSTLVWYDENVQIPTQEEVEQEIVRLQAEYEAQQYARDRAPEYPSIGDQLDALFHAGVFPEEMAAQIQAVKDAYPKPTQEGA